jgi:16S rRNA (cytidine1402-2'-O)-methyltransferase
MAGTLFVVATPIGNLEDITLRALRVLREVDLIAAEDTRRTAHLLSRYGIATKTTSLHEHNEAGKSRAVIGRLEAGESVALVSDAGTPGISDPGALLVSEAQKAGIRVEPVPGPSAVTALLSVTGWELDGFAFLGFPPTRAKDRKSWLSALGARTGVVVFYESPHRIERTLRDVEAVVGDVEVVVARELTKAHENLVKTPISRAIGSLSSGKGEFAVAMYLAERQNLRAVANYSPADVVGAYGELTDNGDMTRREAITALAKRYERPSKEIYAVLEAAKKDVR